MAEKTYTLDDLKEAFINGFYEGAGDDLWYHDHNTPDSSLIPTAAVNRPLREYLAELGEKSE